MIMFKILGIALAGTVTAIVLKEYKPVFAVGIGCMTAIIIFIMLLEQISYVFDVIHLVASRLSLQDEYIEIIIRIIGIAYLARFGSEICRDAGQNAIAQKIELAGKIIIVVTSIPILTAVLNLLIGILPA
ncbi:MAG: stage III sporulation protein AD [Clostridia bacterium]|nr:stage III sporulation protein AD [Clostridia bacterium]